MMQAFQGTDKIRALGLKFFLCAILSLTVSNAFASHVSLGWDANAEPNLAGYKMHYGSSSGRYGLTQDVGKATGCTVPDLTPGQKYFFAVTAYNTAGDS